MSKIDIIFALATGVFAFIYMIVIVSVHPSALLIAAIVTEVVVFITVFSFRFFAMQTKAARAETAVVAELVRHSPRLQRVKSAIDKLRHAVLSVLLVLVPVDLSAFLLAYFHHDQISQAIYTRVPTANLLGFDPAYTLELLAGAYIEHGGPHDRQRAKELCAQMYKIRVSIFGESHEMVASILADIADLYRKEYQFASAQIYYERALQISRAILKDSKMGSLLTRIGTNLSDLGRYAEAETFYQEAIAMRIKDFGAESTNVAESTEKYAILLDKIGRKAESKILFEKCSIVLRRYRDAKEPVSKIPEIIAMFTISCVASYFLIGPKGYLTSMAVDKLRKSIDASNSVNEQDLERLISLYEFQRKKKEASEYRAYRANSEGEASKSP